MELRRLSELSPIAGWPGEYAAWVTDLMLEYDRAIEDRKAHAQGGK